MGSAASSDIRAPSSLEPLARGTKVGRFVVKGLVGRGGMGEVYAAHDPELDRTVAIKLLRAQAAWGGDALEGRARLLREAQAIAKVSHPNVVVAYDVGTHDGRVFIAMEFLEGHTLAYWLQAARRSLAEILDVFCAAGRGLQAAHEKDLVHRDFKPDNVMVSAGGNVRVMDFGLVRLPGLRSELPVGPRRSFPVSDLDDLDPMTTQIVVDIENPAPMLISGDSLSSALTQAGAVMGTPAYMSPEQFSGGLVDGRSDQFSFCVALYEALYGERPFTGTSYAELVKVVVAGGVNPPPPASQVPPAIRAILLQGLSPCPEQRFASMNELLEALRQESTWTTSRDFEAAAFAKLESIWETRRTTPSNPSASAESSEGCREPPSRAEIQRAFLATGRPYAGASFEATSRALDRFARRWIEIYVDACAATHVRGEQSAEVLDLRMGALEEALGDLRALCLQLRQANPDLVENAAQAVNALGTLERCSDVKVLRAIVRPPEDPDTRAAVDSLRGRLSELRAFVHAGRMAEGLKLAGPLEVDSRKTGYAPLLAEVLLTTGLLYARAYDDATGAKTLEDAAWTAELCRHDEVTAEAAAHLVFLSGYVQSRFDAGEIWARHSETVLRRLGGHDLLRAWLFNNRGAMRAGQGRLREAVDDALLAVEEKRKALGTEDPDVALSLSNAASYLDELGEAESAAKYAFEAVQILTATLGIEHPLTAPPLNNYAEILNRLGRFAEAREHAAQALHLFEQATEPDGLYVTYALTALALSHMGCGRAADAVPLLERAVRIREAKETNLAKLAEVHFALGRALWEARPGQEGSRALALVMRSDEEFAKAPATPNTERERLQIARWLARLAPAVARD